MQNIHDFINLVIASIGTGLTYIFGGWNVAMIALLAFIVIDYITGVLVATFNKELSSSTGAKGLAKKALIILVLILAAMLDRIIDSENWLCRTMVCYFYIANEGISIVENAAALGLPIPKKIIDVLEQLKGKSEE